jgi:hypothetical protein
VAGAIGSTALRSHFGASLEDHGPNVVLYRAGPQLPDAPEAYGAMITRAKAAPPQSRSADLAFLPPRLCCLNGALRISYGPELLHVPHSGKLGLIEGLILPQERTTAIYLRLQWRNLVW